VSAKRILVVGTTPDYVALMRENYLARVVFITDEKWATSDAPAESTRNEVFWDLSDYDGAMDRLDRFLADTNVAVSGIACFDCESMELASLVAARLGRDFISPECVRLIRNKYLTREVWRKHRLPSPAAEIVYTQNDVVSFFDRVHGPVVLKPISGSGSEFVFKCTTRSECSRAFMTIKSRLTYPPDERMYPDGSRTSPQYNPRTSFVVEEFVEGEEFSCDFVVDGDSTKMLRIAEKVIARDQAFGTTLAYIIPGRMPDGVDIAELERIAGASARSLGIERSVCMLDFMIRDGKPVLIELSPRPGGDCLPYLMLWSGNFDILAYTLNFAEGIPCSTPDYAIWKPHVGLRLLAEQEGTISELAEQAVSADSRVREVKLKRTAGHRIVLPPFDYDSRSLGRVIFRPDANVDILTQCSEIRGKLRVNMRAGSCRAPKAS